MARYTLWEAVAPCWHDVLIRTGMPADPSPQQVAAWQASPRGWAVRPDVVEAIARRAAGETVSALAADLGIDRRNLSGRLTTAVPALLAPWLHDVPAWRLGREQGHSLGELAGLYEVPEHLIGVALDGWPDLLLHADADAVHVDEVAGGEVGLAVLAEALDEVELGALDGQVHVPRLHADREASPYAALADRVVASSSASSAPRFVGFRAS